MSFSCSGKKAGEVDMTVELNYTKVQSGIVKTEDQRTFIMVIRRECLKVKGTCLKGYFTSNVQYRLQE